MANKVAIAMWDFRGDPIEEIGPALKVLGISTQEVDTGSDMACLVMSTSNLTKAQAKKIYKDFQAEHGMEEDD